MEIKKGGKTYKQTIGSRVQVMHGTALKTVGGLTKKQLKMNKWGRIVSRRKSEKAKRVNNLEKHGYFAKKGKFGFVKKDVAKTRRTRKH